MVGRNLIGREGGIKMNDALHKTLGRIGFEGFEEYMKAHHLKWEDLSPALQGAWEAAAITVKEVVEERRKNDEH